MSIAHKYHSVIRIKNSIVERHVIIKRRSIQFWAMKVKRRHRLRYIFQKILDDGQRRSKLQGFNGLLQNALQVVAALIIQKNIRTLLERTRCAHCRTRNSVATYLQSVARCFLGKHAYQHTIAMRQEAAVIIQRSYRARRGRLIAINRRISKSEKIHSDQINYVQHWQSLNNGFMLLQNRFRLLQRAASESEKTFKVQREKEVSICIQSSLESFQLKRRIFEQQLKEYYDGLITTREEKRASDETCRKHDLQVRHRAIRREFENRRLEKAKRDDEKRMQWELHRKNMMAEWRRKAEAQSDLYKQYCLHCFKSPQTVSERSLCAKIKGIVKARYDHYH